MTVPLVHFWFGAPPGADDRERVRVSAERRANHKAHVVPVDTRGADARSIDAIRAGDISAFERLYVGTFEALWGFAATLLGTRDGAEDVVHDVFLDIWRRRAEWDVRGSVRGYLFGAVRYRIGTLRHRDAVGARLLEHVIDVEDGVPERSALSSSRPVPPDQLTEDADLAQRIRRAIDALPDRQRTAVLFRWLGELNATDIAREMGVTDTAVRKLLRKADETLRKAVGHIVG